MDKWPERVSPTGQMKRGLSTIEKTEVFIYRCADVHGNVYDYSNVVYTATKFKIPIICPKHGKFLQIAADHLKGKGCSRCKGSNVTKTTKEFIEDAREEHGSLYDYDRSVYTKATGLLVITCKIHGDFYQAPYMHLSGRGCPPCGNRKHNILYLATDGNYYKFGVTTNNVSRRMRDLSRGMNKTLVVLAEIRLSDPLVVEKTLLNLPYKNPYLGEFFTGHTEWRDIPENDIKKIIEEYYTC
jgi:hypothetical protein